MDRYELFIVGAGAAGISAAVAAWDAGARSILLADRCDRLGGILPQCVHHGFGLSSYGVELTGVEYARELTEELAATGVTVSLQTAVLSVSADKTALLSSRAGLRRIGFERMILATGAREENLGSLAVSGTRPAGIFTAGQAQELINLRRLDIGAEIVIVGSGDLGMILARRLTLEGKHVVALIEKEKSYGGMARNYHRCIEQYSIPVHYNTALTRIYGEERVSAVNVRDRLTGQERRIGCDTLVTAIGLTPERTLTSRLGAPDWLALCGNCAKIHDIVDSAVSEAKETGKLFGSHGGLV